MTSELSIVFDHAAQLADAATSDLFHFVCHQQPDRLMQCGTNTFHLCPRCFGLHVGFYFGMLFFRIAVPRRRLHWTWIVGYVLISLTTGVEWLLEREALLVPDAGTQIMTALFSGAGGAMLLLLYRDFRGISQAAVPEPAVMSIAVAAFLLPLLLGRADGLYLLLAGTALLAVLGNAWSVLKTLRMLLPKGV